MTHFDIERRSFLLSAAAGSAGTLLGRGRTTAQPEQTSVQPKITEPFHGAVLNHRHGRQSRDGLSIRVSGEASPQDRVTVNGQACRREGTLFSTDIVLRDMETDLVAMAVGNDGTMPGRILIAESSFRGLI